MTPFPRRHPPFLFACALALTACAATSKRADAASPLPQSSRGIDVPVPRIAHPAGETAAWWFRDGASQAAARGAMDGRAKNVIIFLGDGMSLTTVAAARIFEGQRKGGSGEENRLAWETFPATALSKTYLTDAQTPESAGTMSAIATGVKTRAGVLSIGQAPARQDCVGGLAAPLLTLWELASSSGMATGVVTTARVTHATPGATYAHTAERNWENDAEMPARVRRQGCIDVARQLVETPFGRGFDVVMGGGRENFMPAAQRDPEEDDKVGKRLDGRDLIAEWKQRNAGGVYAWNKAQFDAAPLDKPLLALFRADHMQFEHDRPADPGGEPSLAEMTRAAIARLSRNQNGYVLLVEAGRIDHANHYGNAYRALTDTVAFSDAVRVASEATSSGDTLVIVTADHSHVLTFVGYPRRGNPILGKVRGGSGEDDDGGLVNDGLGLPYTTLSYANGPGYTGASISQPAGPKRYPHMGRDYEAAQGRPDLHGVDTEDPDYMQEATVPLNNETHGGDDVGIWASGPGSDAIRGSVEQNAIFHFAAQATPRLRAALCAKGLCDANGVPVELPKIQAFKPR